jgi:hypothetical protein
VAKSTELATNTTITITTGPVGASCWQCRCVAVLHGHNKKTIRDQEKNHHGCQALLCWSDTVVVTAAAAAPLCSCCCIRMKLLLLHLTNGALPEVCEKTVEDSTAIACNPLIAWH